MFVEKWLHPKIHLAMKIKNNHQSAPQILRLANSSAFIGQ